MKLKVCGITDPSDYKALCAMNIDYLGFIFVPSSPRCIEKLEPPDFICSQEMTKHIAVFRNQPFEVVNNILSSGSFELAQLHGDESPEFVRSIRSTFPEIGIVKVISLPFGELAVRSEDYKQLIDFFLFDTHCVQGGGSGKSFDWSVLKGALVESPFFLGGGIGLHNIEEVKKLGESLPLYALDVNSRVETKPGRKDLKRIRQLIEKLSL